MTYHGLAEQILRKADTPLSANEIWNLAIQEGLDKELNSQGKTPSATLAARMYVIVKENPNGKFATVGERPKRFYLRDKEYKDFEKFEKGMVEEELVQSQKSSKNYLEKDLHPFLAYFAYSQLSGCYTKTINHSNSTKKEYGAWVHPDMVGCLFPIDQWQSEVLELSNQIGNISIKFYSFELKRKLDFSNLRESFFQAVSNSSWANEGYLVAADISKEPDFEIELKRLTTSFGIGVIELDIESPDSSTIIFPAKEKDNLDWDTINKMARMNKDFQMFLKRVKNDMSIKEITEGKYDRILDVEKLVKTIQ